MTRLARRYRWQLLWVGLVSGLAIGPWFVCRWTAPEPGWSEDVFARVRIGMSRDETVAVLRTHNGTDGLYSEGATSDGRSWSHLESPSFEGLPPAQEIAHGTLTVGGDDGREIEVILGPGGFVSDKRLSPGVWQYRLDRTCHALACARHDVSSERWWDDQLRKTEHSLRRRRQYVAPCLAAGLLLTSAWAVRRRVARRGPSPGHTEAFPLTPNPSPPRGEGLPVR
jgi:hypothetical protein